MTFGGGAGVVSAASGADSFGDSFAASAVGTAAESGEEFEASLEAAVESLVTGAAVAGGFPLSGAGAGLAVAGADAEASAERREWAFTDSSSEALVNNVPRGVKARERGPFFRKRPPQTPPN